MRAWLTLLVTLALVQPLTAQSLKVYISADMEGVAGVVTSEQLGPSGFEYERFREFMTAEVNAAIAAAREAGAGEILISDSHGNGQNLLLELLPDDVMVIRSWPRPLSMMAGIDSTFDGAIFIGYHASTTNTEGVRAHTMSSARLTAVKLNGIPVPEAGINAAIAGYFGVPVIMVSGDDAAVEETYEVVGDVEGAVVKWNYGFHSARTLTPASATELIAAKVRDAMGRINDFEPVVIATPVVLEVSFKNYLPVEVLGYLPNVERVDSHTIRFVGRDMVETSKFLTFITTYEPGLSP